MTATPESLREGPLVRKYINVASFLDQSDIAAASSLAKQLVDRADVTPQVGTAFADWWTVQFSPLTDFSESNRKRIDAIQQRFADAITGARMEDLPLLLVAQEFAAFEVADAIQRQLAEGLQQNKDDVLALLLVALERSRDPARQVHSTLCDLIGSTKDKRALPALFRWRSTRGRMLGALGPLRTESCIDQAIRQIDPLSPK